MYVGWHVSVHGFSAYRCVRRVLCPFARGVRGPPVFRPGFSSRGQIGSLRVDYPIDRGKKSMIL